jgi:quercetin dioxygenase-like cupin family protein
MNLAGYHSEEKPVSTKLIFSGEGKVIAIHIKAGEQFKEHITTVPAFLICVTGKAVFENEFGFSKQLYNGETIHIEQNVKHWINATTESNFVLIK